MKVFSIIGISKSGKTTTAEAIISELCRRGYTVGSVKDIHFTGFALDQEGTNTHRHKQAGAQPVTARGLYETDVMFPQRLSLSAILAFYHQDFVVLEGALDFRGPGIIAACTEGEIEDRKRDNIFAIAGQISNRLTEYLGLPVIDARSQAGKLVDLIEKLPAWTGKEEWIDKES
ncbi:MAG: molybdopterin-guanine dinucleotide biosynthesis protein B [Syntrophomonadaceae bacterium]|jgi:molybdopterin-guanine dinucleotide biosynthesis protein B|nr:molybdopterin-guanine dinucleotide biosynthesis protein B [Syntrophomonadaceae bacterium]